MRWLLVAALALVGCADVDGATRPSDGLGAGDAKPDAALGADVRGDAGLADAPVGADVADPDVSDAAQTDTPVGADLEDAAEAPDATDAAQTEDAAPTDTTPGDASLHDAVDVPEPADVVSPKDAPDASDGPYVGLVKVYNTTCQVTGAPTPPPLLKLEKVLSGASIAKPVQLVTAPDSSGRVFIVSQPGRIHVAAGVSAAGSATVWLDIVDQVDDGPNEGGLLSMALHPDFATNGWVFVNYTRTHGGKFQTLVSRFTVPSPSSGAPDPATEVEILTVDQPFGNHNGGQIAFGPDGMLYVGMGDGGSGGDPQGHGQSLATLLGAMLRIDVSAPAGGYAIPPDNPFVGQTGARGEIWAYGLRNPWRFSFDPVSGTLWAGDVGQNAVEEIDIIVKGGNYGWKLMEGSSCYSPPTGCSGEGLILPVAEYDHSQGKSVTGGHVYRGAAMPALVGTYLYGDFSFGTIWGLAPGSDGAWAITKLVDTNLFISAFGVGPDGETYVLDWGGGIYRLVAQDPGAAGEPGWPPTLTATGCFSDVPSATLADGILRYEVNSPLWSDGASKDRALVLPPGGMIGYKGTGAWDLPEGTILIKTFALQKRLETRFLVRNGGEWRGATYRWNDAQTEAHLLAGAATEDLGTQVWSYPSRGDCTGCHTKAAGGVLGLSSGQMNTAHDMLGNGTTYSQVGLLAALDYFSGGPAAGDAVPAFPDPADETAPLADRARSYLHANCAHCHVPGGLANATIDLRYDTPLAATGVCGPAQQGDLGVPGAKIIAPGDPGKSTLLLRMETLDGSVRMPPLASNVVDAEGAALISAWIASMSGCP